MNSVFASVEGPEMARELAQLDEEIASEARNEAAEAQRHGSVEAYYDFLDDLRQDAVDIGSLGPI